MAHLDDVCAGALVEKSQGCQDLRYVGHRML